MNESDPVTIGALITDLGVKDGMVRERARQSLVAIGGPAVAPLIEALADRNENMRWEAAPKPRLTDASYKPGYTERVHTIEQRLKAAAAKDFVTTEKEPLFDAAEFARFGKDIVIQHGYTANLAGIDWVQRHFPDLRIHAMNFPGDPYPIHIDCTFIPLRPGLVLHNPIRKVLPEHKKFFEINDWEIVEAAQPAHEEPPHSATPVYGSP